MSRPRMPDQERKSVRVLVRLTPGQAQTIKGRCATGKGQPGVSTMLRNIIISSIAGSAA